MRSGAVFEEGLDGQSIVQDTFDLGYNNDVRIASYKGLIVAVKTITRHTPLVLTRDALTDIKMVKSYGLIKCNNEGSFLSKTKTELQEF